LRDAVINAIQEKYKAQEVLDAARRAGQPDGHLAFLLSKAKNSQRTAERSYTVHVEQHGCNEEPGAVDPDFDDER
jgi:hypothetical protein